MDLDSDPPPKPAGRGGGNAGGSGQVVPIPEPCRYERRRILGKSRMVARQSVPPPLIVDLDSTILAVATPPVSLRGMIRIAGPDAVGLVNGILRAPPPGATGVYPVRTVPQLLSLPALAVLFSADRGPIGQPVVELWLPGNPELLHRVLSQLLERGSEYGARLASPGEFTARSWMLGRMDLTQAEGVGLLVSAEHTAVRAAHRLLAGGPGKRIKELREQILDLLATLEAGIDFPIRKTSISSNRRSSFHALGILKSLQLIRERGVPLERFQGPPRIMVVGPPNAGKSTLCNAALRRAILNRTN